MTYSLIRVGIFVAVFATLMLLQIDWWISAIIAAIIGLCVSYIFFGELRRRVAEDLAARRERPVSDRDADVEDR